VDLEIERLADAGVHDLRGAPRADHEPADLLERVLRRAEPDALRVALDVIAETFANYVQATLEAGASGIFFATTGWASSDMLTEEQYRRFGREYDQRVMDAFAGKAPLNVLHNCGEHIYFDLLADYPVAAVSWAATLPGNPSLGEGKERTTKAVMGGVSEKTTSGSGAFESPLPRTSVPLGVSARRQAAGECVPARWKMRSYFVSPRVKSSRV